MTIKRKKLTLKGYNSFNKFTLKYSETKTIETLGTPI